MKESLKAHKKAVIVVIAILIGGVCIGGYVSYKNHLKAVRQEAIKKTNESIDEAYQNFQKESERTGKLDILKTTVQDYKKYKKSEDKEDECIEAYKDKIASMKKYFTDDYNKSIKKISDEVGDKVEDFSDKDKLNSYVTTLTELKTTIKNDYEEYKVIDKEKFDEYSKTIDAMVKSYNDRIAAIKKAEEEAAKKKAEEEAKAKAAATTTTEATLSQQQAESNNADSSDGVTSYSDNSGNYDNGGSYDYSSGNSGSYSGGSGNGGYQHWTYGWAGDGTGNGSNYTRNDVTGDVYDENGNYVDNVNNWK